MKIKLESQVFGISKTILLWWGGGGFILLARFISNRKKN